jgi:hypothetical protein
MSKEMNQQPTGPSRSSRRESRRWCSDNEKTGKTGGGVPELKGMAEEKENEQKKNS